MVLSVLNVLFSNRIDDFLKRAIVVAEVHFHLLDAGFASVIRFGLRVQENGNHLIGETILGKTADAHIPLAEFGIKFEKAL